MRLLKKETAFLTNPLSRSFRMRYLIPISTKNHQQSSLKSMSPSLQQHHLGGPRPKKNQRKILRPRKLMTLVNR